MMMLMNIQVTFLLDDVTEILIIQVESLKCLTVFCEGCEKSCPGPSWSHNRWAHFTKLVFLIFGLLLQYPQTQLLNMNAPCAFHWPHVVQTVEMNPVTPLVEMWKQNEAARWSPLYDSLVPVWGQCGGELMQTHCDSVCVCGWSILSGCPCSLQQWLTWHRGYVAVPGGRACRWWTLHNCSPRSNWRCCGPWSLYSGWVPGLYLQHHIFLKWMKFVCPTWGRHCSTKGFSLSEHGHLSFSLSLSRSLSPLLKAHGSPFGWSTLPHLYVYSCLTFFLSSAWNETQAVYLDF